MLLYVNWDGFSRDLYERAHRAGATRTLDGLIARGAELVNHTCGIPAITNPMQQTLVSGAFPVKTGNCYAYFDKQTRRVVQTGRLNPCENLCEAAQRQGKTCASVHGWYFGHRGCEPGDGSRPYIQNNLPNFETRVQLLLDYLDGRPVPSGDGEIKMRARPDFLAIYADDIDTVCHNGRRLNYPELSRAKTLNEWYDNLIFAVRRMDAALKRLTDIDGATLALAADHGGMPFGTAMGEVSDTEAKTPRADALLAALARADVAPYVLKNADDTPPRGAQSALLLMGTQALLYYLSEPGEGVRRAARENVLALPFIHRCMDAREQSLHGAKRDYCDLYITARAPYYLNGDLSEGFTGGSHAATEDSVMRPFCAFCGEGVRAGARVEAPTNLTDFAPTAAALMGISPPRDATGRVITEILSSHGG